MQVLKKSWPFNLWSMCLSRVALPLLLKLWAVKGKKVIVSVCVKKCSTLSAFMFITVTVQTTRKTARNKQRCEFREHIFNVQYWNTVPTILGLPLGRTSFLYREKLEKEQLNERQQLIQSSTAEVTQPGQWQASQMEHLIVAPGIPSARSEGKWTVVTCDLLYHTCNVFPSVVKICIWIVRNVLFLSGKGTIEPAGVFKKTFRSANMREYNPQHIYCISKH